MTTSNALRVAIAGCGRAAENLYLPALPAAGLQLVAVSDRERARAELIAQRVEDCLVHPSVESLLEQTSVEALLVLTPPETHLEVASVAIERHVPVLVEKPLETSLARAERLRSLAAARAVPVMVGYNRRWLEPVVDLRRRLAGRGPGLPVSLDSVFESAHEVWSPIAGVRDPLDDLVPHHVDLARHLTEREVRSVRSVRTAELAVRVECRLSDGSSLRCVAAQSRRSIERIDVRCGSERYRLLPGSRRIRPHHSLGRMALDTLDNVIRRVSRQPAPMARSYRRQLEEFARCLRSEERPAPGPDAGMAAMRAVEAARTSLAQDGAWVPVGGSPSGDEAVPGQQPPI